MGQMLHIGTSGWHYPHWENGVFYPPGLARTSQLSFYAQHFKTVELNASFYHLPRPKTFEGWRQKTPDDFVFAVKASRYISHVKRLRDCQEPWEKLSSAAKELGEKLGLILFQLPPSLEVSPRRLEAFLRLLPEEPRYSFEFRHASWLCDGVYDILRSQGVALCIPDSPGMPKSLEVTAPFVYVRMHGSASPYGSKYTDEELEQWAGRIKGFLKRGLEVYVYFNNDAYGYALQNAEKLEQLLAD